MWQILQNQTEPEYLFIWAFVFDIIPDNRLPHPHSGSESSTIIFGS